MFSELFKALDAFVGQTARGFIVIMSLRLVVIVFLLIYLYSIGAVFPVFQGLNGFIAKASFGLLWSLKLACLSLATAHANHPKNSSNPKIPTKAGGTP